MAADQNTMNEVSPDSDLNKLGGLDPMGEDGQSETAIARENWRRYEYVRQRGHVEYCAQARRNEDFYLGAGLQWAADVKQQMEQVEGRPASEINEVLGAVNSAIGYQISNRMDVHFVPASADASPETAKALSLVFKEIYNNTLYKWHETQVFGDGLIPQRGYFDIRLDMNDNIQAEISIGTDDPMDVIPDPDAKSYDPQDWLDVTVTRWLNASQIEERYGSEAADKVKLNCKPREGDFGDGMWDDGIWRNRFGDPRSSANEFTASLTSGADLRYRIIDRQHHKTDWCTVAVYPTGEVSDISQASNDELKALKAQGVLTTVRRIKRVRWTVSAAENVLIWDKWSPFKRFTIVPFFPIFRRGRTRGLVDNAISPQETLNKAVSQAITIVNTSANSGWKVPQNSLTNMETSDLETLGGQSGLVMEYDPKIGEPKKIDANSIPTGITNLITMSLQNIKDVTMINDSMSGAGPQDRSGVAEQARQFAAQQSMALPLDNLARTRYMVAEIVLEFVQKYMSDERVIRVTQHAPDGTIATKQITVNQVQPDGSILHDLTVGKYDVVITDQPMQITFDNSQFEQIKSLSKDFGYRVPPSIALRYSNLPDKAEVGPALEQANSPAPNPVDEAKANLANAQAENIKAKTGKEKVTTIYEATQAGAQAAAMPGVAGIADSILQATGFGGAPIPQGAGAGGGVVPVPPLASPEPSQQTQMPGQAPDSIQRDAQLMKHNTHPNFPANPDQGIAAGIEGGKQ